MLEWIPRFAAVAGASGVTFGSDAQLVRHDGWSLDSEATDEQMKKLLNGAAFHDSSLHMVPYKIDACDVQPTGARRVMCAGFITRSLSQFPSKLPRYCSVPRTDQMEEGALGTIAVVQ